MGIPKSFLIVTVLSLCFANCHGEFCPKHEREALLTFRVSFEGPASGRLISWKGQNCCEWEGIACGEARGFVIKVDISGMRLQPVNRTVDKSLFALKYLEYVDFSRNNFEGVSIPTELGLLGRLTYLDLSNAGFSGEIPWQLGDLPKLEYLSLSRDIFSKYSSGLWVSDLSWIRNLSSLRHLSLDGVDLRPVGHAWDDCIAGLSELRRLRMAGCRLTGVIPPSLLNITHLAHLDLSYNTFSPQLLPQWLSNMTSLVSLNLSGCALTGPVQLSELPHLQELALDGNFNLSVDVSAFINSNNWPLLTRLSLSSCNLDGMITSSIPNKIPGISYLDLSSNKISGVIPHSVGNLHNLRLLDLSFNNITGTVPQSLSLLENLLRLDLRHNQLSGQIPASLSQLSRLQYLALGHNNLSGTIPKAFSHLFELDTLDISFNYLTDTVSETLFQNLGRLKYLHLSNSGLTVNILSSAWSPPFYLEQLYLPSCKAGGRIPDWLSNQHTIVLLDLSNNEISGKIPYWLWTLPNLAQVNLSKNNLEGTLPPHIRLNPRIGPRVVDLHSNRLQGPLPLGFGYVEVVDLSDNQFSGSISSEFFQEHRTMNFLSLSKNTLSGEIPKSLSGSRYLEILDLSNNSFSGDLRHRFSNCTSLVVLILANNLLGGELPRELGNMRKLQTLHMNNNNFTGDLPSSLQNCRALEIVELGDNNLSGTIPSWIHLLSRLRILVLRSNNLQGNIPEDITLLNNMQILDLSHNNLTGVIPHSLGNFGTMTDQSIRSGSFILRYVIGFGMTISFYRADAEGGLGLFYGADVEVMSKGQDMRFDRIPSIETCIDLSGNRLVGPIPAELGKLTGLVTLNISRNNLSGSIPETLGNMKQMESLDLSWNQISGTIPVQLTKIDFLEILNVSNNRLSGTIPRGRHFDTLDATSFWGNPELCGYPLDRKCVGVDGPSATTPSHDPDDADDEDEDEDGTDPWWGIAVGLSYAIGFSGVITILAVNEKWRDRYNEFLDTVVFGPLARLFGAAGG